MANISLPEVESQMRRWFRTEGIGIERFDSDLLSSVKRAVGRINRQADLETRITHPANLSSTIGLDEDYLDVFEDLVALNLRSLGQRAEKALEAKLVAAERTIDARIDDIRQDILNQAVEADTDDETDFAGLGALG